MPLRASWRQRGINDLGAEWFTYGQVGGNSNFGTEFHQPLDQLQHYFVEGRYRFDQRRLNLSRDARVLARALVDGHHVDLAPGINFATDALGRAGFYPGTANTDVEIGAPELSSRSDNDGGYFTELGYDSLDRPYFPGSGLRLLSRYAWSNGSLGASEDYEAWNTSAFGSFSFGRNSFTAIGRWAELDLDDAGNTVTGSDVFLSRAYSLGGFLALSGYTSDSLAGNYLGFAGLTYYRRLTEQSLLPVDMPVYAGASLEAGNTWLDESDASFDDLIYAGSLFLGVDSPVGPIYLGVGMGENSQYALFLKIGQIFD